MKRLFVPGVFDVFHIGHLNYLKRAAQHGDHVIVGIQDDRSVFQSKGVRPVIPLAERIAIIESLRFVDEVISYTSVFQGPLFSGLGINIFACGDEYGQDDRYPDQKRTLAYCREHEIDVVHIPRTAEVSSTNIRGRLKEFWDSRAQLSSNLQSGVTVLGSFKGDQNKVSEETAKECNLILNAVGETAGKSLLDLGCGDGRQLAPLVPHFGRVVGVDFSPKLLELAQQRLTANGTTAELVEGDASEFVTKERFDVILLSGITPYLDDHQLKQMIVNIQTMSHPETQVLIRTSIGLSNRINVVNQFSEELKSRYTAYYRTIPEMQEIFGIAGYQFGRTEQLYQHRADTAVWWFELTQKPAGIQSLKGPHFLNAASARSKLSETFQD